MTPGRVALVVGASVLVTLLAGVVLRNLTAGEQRVERTIPRKYSINNPDFVRCFTGVAGPRADCN